MARYPVLKSLLVGSLIWMGGAAHGQAVNAPGPDVVLKFKPRQADVVVATPSAEEVASCKVEEIRAGGAIIGWHLLDAKKQTLRKFYDSRGGKNIDTWSYYKDGVEVYREIDTNADGKADQFRWLNAGGMKWGVDLDGDGTIDAWRMISAEEVGHEMFQALATNDFARMKALQISEAEVRALKLTAAEASRIAKVQQQAKAQFDKVQKSHPNLTKGATYLRIESGTPHCIPDEAGSDLIKYPTRSILFETADKKHDWIQTGEIIKVGSAWRLVEVSIDSAVDPVNPNPSINPQLQKLLTELDVLDKQMPPGQGAPGKNVKVQAYNQDRVGLIKKIIQVVENKDKEIWWKQMFDNLSAGAQAGDEGALKELSGYRAQLEKSMKGANLTAYAAYREMWATYGPMMIEQPKGKSLKEVQEEWHDALSKFVLAYSKSDDAADALHQLAVNCEFSGKDETAKRWYNQLYTAFPDHPYAEKAKGAEKRLDLVGQTLELQAPTLSGQNYNIAQSKGKVVVIYYYSSTVAVSVGDFARLKQIVAKNAKDVELVCVNLDETIQAAKAFFQANSPPGIHLFDGKEGAAGQNSRLALQYGINGLPTMFLVGGNGRVLNRTLQVSDLEEALRRAISN